MQNTINSDLIRGNINTIILKALFEGDRYGYDIIKEIEQKSSGQYVLKQPTLYSCLKRLEVQGFIRSYWGAKSNGGRRKYYTLTDMGHELFARNQSEWEYSRTVIDKLISDREYDFSKLEADYNNEIAAQNADKGLSEDAFNLLEEYNEAGETGFSESDDLESIKRFNEAACQNDENQTEKEEELQCEYLSTAKILDELFQTQKEDIQNDSYTGKLVNESYTAIPQKKPPEFNASDYFTDVESDEAEAYDEPYVKEKLPPTPYSQAEKPELPIKQVQPSPAPERKTQSDFISYKSKVDYEEDENRALLERDYKNVLTQLVKNQSAVAPEADGDKTPSSQIPLSKETARNNEFEEISAQPSATEKSTEKSFKTAENNKKLTAISSSFKELGDNIFIRTHQTTAATGNVEKSHYYSNRLLFVQYAILFSVMLTMVIVTFLIARIGLGINGPIDNYVYIGAILLATAFPVVAAILKYRNPNRKQRRQFDFTNAIIFRTVIMLNCFVIIYCINVMLEMSLSFSNASTYLCSLLLPSLFALCLPLDVIIRNTLYNSERFSA